MDHGTSQVVLVVKNLPANAGDLRHEVSILRLGIFPREGNGNLLHYSCLENCMGRGPWQATVYRVTKIGHAWSNLGQCWSQKTGKFLNSWEYQSTLPSSWETCIQVRKQQLEPDVEQWTGSKLGKSYDKAVYYHPADLTYMQNTYVICWAGWSSSWNQDFQEKYQ